MIEPEKEPNQKTEHDPRPKAPENLKPLEPPDINGPRLTEVKPAGPFAECQSWLDFATVPEQQRSIDSIRPLNAVILASRLVVRLSPVYEMLAPNVVGLADRLVTRGFAEIFGGTFPGDAELSILLRELRDPLLAKRIEVPLGEQGKLAFGVLLALGNAIEAKPDGLKRAAQALAATQDFAAAVAPFGDAWESQEAVRLDLVLADRGNRQPKKSTKLEQANYQALFVHELWPAGAPGWFVRQRFDWPALHARMSERLPGTSEELRKRVEKSYPWLVREAEARAREESLKREAEARAQEESLKRETEARAQEESLKREAEARSQEESLKRAARHVQEIVDLSKASFPPSEDVVTRFLEAEESLLKQLYDHSLVRPREDVRRHLQEHLSALRGASFGESGNRLWVALMNHFFNLTELRVNCLKKECSEKLVPSLLRYRASTDKKGVPKYTFSTEHHDDKGKQRHHGGKQQIPELNVVPQPAGLDFWRTQQDGGELDPAPTPPETALSQPVSQAGR